MGALNRDDLSVIEGGARISSRRLMEVLGFTRIDTLHKLIRAHQEELEDLGGIFRFEAEKSGRGRPSLTYFLNEHQAVAVCLWAETPKAREARRMVIEVFLAHQRGDGYALAVQRQQPDPFAANAERVRAVASHVASLAELDSATARLTHLPIWSNGRRPPWWSNPPLREFLTAAHRQMTLAQCLVEARRLFGPACVPSVSGLQRYWARLDTVLGPASLALPAPEARG